MEITDKHIEQFLAAAHQTGERRLTRCSSGNLSWRIGEFAPDLGNRLLASRTASRPNLHLPGRDR